MSKNDDNITKEEWDALPRDERIKRILMYLGSEHNKYMADAMEVGKDITGLDTFDFVVKALLGDFHERMNKIINNFNESCKDVFIKDVTFQDIDPLNLTCKVVPDLRLIDED